MNAPGARDLHATKWRASSARRSARSSSPVLTTSLYLVVFGAAIGSRMPAQSAASSYGAFIVPGLIMLTLLSESISNAQLRHLHAAIHRRDLRAAARARGVRSRR